MERSRGQNSHQIFGIPSQDLQKKKKSNLSRFPCTSESVHGMLLNVGLTLYRRHLASCQVHQLPLKARQKRQFAACNCPIWIYGRTGSIMVPRQSLGTRDMKEAEAKRTRLAADEYDKTVHGFSLTESIDQFLASHALVVGEVVMQQYKLLLTRLADYCSSRGVVYMRDLTVDALEGFKVRGFPDVKDSTRATAVSKMRCFLREAYRRGWIAEPLVEKVRPFPVVLEQKNPFTDEEVQQLLKGALLLRRGRTTYGRDPETFQLLLRLMIETGMRVSDAVRFDPKNLQRGTRLWIYTYLQTKRQKGAPLRPIEAYISDGLKQAIDKCQWLSAERPFLIAVASKYKPGLEVYEIMQRIGSKVGIADCRPHRLRDTFAVQALLRGMNLEDVSRLLGHSTVKVTEAHYAKWVAARKLRLEGIVAQTLMNAAGPTLGH